MSPAPRTPRRIAITAAALAGAGALAVATGPASADAPGAHAAKTHLLSANSSGDLRFSRSRITASRGPVTLRLSNPSPLDHGIAISGNGVRRKGAIVGPGRVTQLTATLKAGTYTFYCPVPDHRAGGMRGRLVVR